MLASLSPTGSLIVPSPQCFLFRCMRPCEDNHLRGTRQPLNQQQSTSFHALAERKSTDLGAKKSNIPASFLLRIISKDYSDPVHLSRCTEQIYEL
jgi:hypothetical protein